MSSSTLRLLYSFPHRIGAGRICSIAWQQAHGVAATGAKVTVSTASVARPLPAAVQTRTTLALGRARLPVRLMGRERMCAWHDWSPARWLQANHRKIDVFHGWPLGSLRSLRVARRHGITTYLERPNTHTAFAYEVAGEENTRLGLELPAGHDHAFNRESLAQEEEEYRLADYLLCPSEFVAGTFRDRGFAEEKLVRHRYGFDEGRFRPGLQNPSADRGLTAIYVGVGEPRKGLHYALEAWLGSGAQERGTFLICGEFVPGYAERLGSMLAHSSVRVLGHRTDIHELMRTADVFVLSSVEEGSALVTYEARASGCVLLVSTSTGAICRHGFDALVHEPRDVFALREHLRQLDADRDELARLRTNSQAGIGDLTWTAAGGVLRDLYANSARN